MNQLVLYIHGKDGNAKEALHYTSLFKDSDVIGLDYQADTPWQAKEEFPQLFDTICQKYDAITIIANSIGAYYAMHALSDKNIKEAFFISPVVNMEKLIVDMMQWANVSEEELCNQGEIATSFNETLSWKYLSYVREHPITWHVPTHVLYGDKDNLTSLPTITKFIQNHNATLTIYPDGEHWFHTEEQMQFLNQWIKSHVL